MSKLTLEVGKYYRTAGGEKRGPAKYDYDDCVGLPWNVPATDNENHWYDINGKSIVDPRHDLVAEWVDEPEEYNLESGQEQSAKSINEAMDRIIDQTVSAYEPKPWGELKDAEKGALLLADFNGEDIEFWYNEEPGWQDCIGGQSPGKTESFAYRRKPEPKRETVTHTWNYAYGFHGDDGPDDPKTTHRITFDTIDGVPDCSTVRMEEIQ